MNEREQEAGRKRSRVEHVFAQQANQLVRSIGQGRVGVKMGMMNLVYNMRRLVWLWPVKARYGYGCCQKNECEDT
ncbi:MAG: hypothetical protein V3U62_03770, partial [Sedimenticolaceae bacterium]